MMFKQQLKAIVLAWTLIGPSAMAEDTFTIVDVPVARQTAPIVKTTANPNYPDAAARQNIQGWVWLDHTIEADGTVSSVRVLHSVPRKTFDRAAKSALKQWVYYPATRDGQPIASSTEVVLTFNLEGRSGVSRRFKSKTKEIESAIENGDFHTALIGIEKLKEITTGSAIEATLINILRTKYHIEREDYKKAALSLRQISEFEWNLLKAATKLAYRKLHFKLEVRLEEYVRAHFIYDAIKREDALTSNDPVHDLYRRILPILNAPTPLRSSSEVLPMCHDCNVNRHDTTLNLLRHLLTIEDLVGDLTTLRFECGNNFALMSYSPDTIWRLPDSFKNCTVKIQGGEGTSFF